MSAPVGGRRPRRWYDVSIAGSLGLFSFVCLVLGRVAEHQPGLLSFLWRCPLKALTGLPCFTCGITRVYLHLGRGEVIEAFVLAPLPALVATLSLVAGAWHLCARLFGRPWPDAVIGHLLPYRPLRMTVAVSFFGLWGYAIVRSVLTGAP